ncbi:hypothetical protein KEJ36_00090 [Candidatus Bathyarchaeota archaeon]|nr:hypothetical protein [Candidatus Bathyarchaeota archaeon]MBS7627224.1 hypothetical protein [Candidatus Bathyarchaeota archaeon]
MKLRALFVGTGGWGQAALRFEKAIPRAELVGVVGRNIDIDIEKVRALAEEMGVKGRVSISEGHE